MLVVMYFFILDLYLLRPGLSIGLKIVFNPHFVGSAHGGSSAIQLAEAAEDTGAYTPLSGGGSAPCVARPAFEGGLDQVTGSVGHL